MARILLVDDEEMDRTLGREILEQAGHQLVYASSGTGALNAYKKQRIDVVVTDLAMPNLNGHRLIQELLQHDKHALIVAVSGVNPEQLERAERLGAAITLKKPYKPTDLLDAVAELLQRPSPDTYWY